MTTRTKEIAAKEFATTWKDRGYEKGESQPFWLSLLRDIFEIEKPEQFIQFENQVKLDHTSFIDGYIPSSHVLIEQKSITKDLRAPIKQSDGTLLNPFQQAKRYAIDLPYSERPRWIVTCNFKSFLIYDMEQPNGEPEEVLLENLEKEYYRLSFLVDDRNIHIQKEMEISLKAGEIIGEIYDELLQQYIEPDDDSLRSLNILCVRLVFCLYAEDAGIFSSRNIFHDYLAQFKPGQGEMREALIKLFEVLDTPVDKRDKYLRPELKAFPYCNGGLFANKNVEVPFFNDKIAHLLLKNASSDFDWSEISPTIFGGVFESTLNPETRRKGGMHYTSIENIHKVIDPLFLNDLKDEFSKIRDISVEKTRMTALTKFQDKLASLTFLDPACGSGNFLTETYLSLRRLENQVIMEMTKGQTILGFDDSFSPVKVNIHQFYGIEINDFAVDVATTALWIAESQMLQETQKIINRELDMLPLKTYHNIKKGNALRLDWEQIINKENLNYIIGNPPFVGYKLLTDEQKDDLTSLIPKMRAVDYVSGWYFKATSYIKGTTIRCAFVSTNSICQGSSIQNMWKSLLSDISIDFAYRTFRWDSEANQKAQVHCVIIGFSNNNNLPKVIYNESGTHCQAQNINPYLIDAPNIIIERTGKSLCNMPEMTKGAQLIDGGGFMINSEDEKNDFLKKYPESEPYIYKYYNAQDFINGLPQKYCLYLKNCPPNIIRTCAGIRDSVNRVYEYRANSSAPTTRILKDTPTLFFQSQVPKGESIVIPVVSSENRKYIPIGFMPNKVVYTNALFYIDGANIYHFGILTSNVHMAWMRVVCGRLEMRYRYSNDIIYNNFPWPTPTVEQQSKIEKTARAILDARNLYPDCSLADLYDKASMPIELKKAHQGNDKAVMEAYGFSSEMSESECVAELMKMYQKLTK